MELDKEWRHLQQMRKSLASRRDSVESLGRLISELESLCVLLETPTSSWRDSFQEQWGTLEEVFAVMLDRDASTMDDEGAKLVADAVMRLEILVNDALGGLPSEPDE